ncbi:hypothetical protein BJ138DRAFT_1168083 [Hygrophoropsis aurantiaca]|uniref:Uncharacterized protein n=1 Tax=Hygrophoropsis aurantiaca TaxID=72124 RepID=A0ACB7ZS09_9AGAM|nr:hypothetical protein BJ138DRAFT_1168083 [Hygrophoropsis aurantiaca]
MAEESAVSYWEKYGHVVFDSTQQAVLMSCVLRFKPLANTHTHVRAQSDPGRKALASGNNGSAGGQGGNGGNGGAGAGHGNGGAVGLAHQPSEEGFVNRRFSFTIRGDKRASRV